MSDISTANAQTHDRKALPTWLKRSIGDADQISTVQKLIKQNQLHTICEEGRCPNRAECYANKTATFLLMGPTCTRSCAFCQVDKGHAPMPIDPQEPHKIATSVQTLGLRYVVLTSVTRDDLPDQGASHFVQTIQAVQQLNPGTQVEVLTPDFWGGLLLGQSDDSKTKAARLEQQQQERIAQVAQAGIACYNHNLETVQRLQDPVRRGGKYDRSLRALQIVKGVDPDLPTKSGLMLGHGETEAEILETLADLRAVGCDRLTLGQYMQPSLAHRPVVKYWQPEEFDRLGQIARDMGFSHVRSGPLVRSSYHAGELE